MSRKILFAIIVGIACFAAAAAAQNNPVPAASAAGPRGHRLECAVRNYAAALRSDNPGLVESALYHAVRVRFACPAADLTALRDQCARLVRDGATRTIRCKAWLAAQVFDDEKLCGTADLECASEDEFFALVAGRVTVAALGPDRRR